MTAASSYIQLSAVKISASSDEEKVVFGTIFSKGTLKNRAIDPKNHPILPRHLDAPKHPPYIGYLVIKYNFQQLKKTP